MAEFDPDKYLEEKGGQAQPEFDPDAYLKEKAAPPSVGKIETFANSGVSTLPFGKQIVTGLTTGVLKGAHALGLGGYGKGVELGPESVQQLHEMGQEPSSNQVEAPGYTQNRSDFEERTAAGEEQNPKTALAGKATGIAAQVLAPMPKMGVGSTWGRAVGGEALPGAANLAARIGGRMASGAALGGVLGGAYGLSGSKADIANGQYRQALTDAIKGAGLGAGLGAAMGGVSGGLSETVGKYAAGKSAQAADEATEAAKQSVQDELASKLGAYRSSIQSASRDLEVIEREAAANGPLADKARAYLATPEAAALKRAVLASKLEQAPGRINEMAQAENAYRGFQGTAEQEAEKRAQEALANPIRKQIIPRVARIAQHQIPPIVGGAVGGVPGAAVGGIVSGVMGNPGRTIANMANNPGVRKMVWDSVQKLVESDPGRLGKYGPALAHALSESPQKGLALHEAFASQSPEYQRMLQGVELKPEESGQ